MRKLVWAMIGGLACVLPAVANTSKVIGIDTLELGQHRADVINVLERLCDRIDPVSATPVQFPLAAEKEEHIRCFGLNADNGVIEKSVFLMADDTLAMIELRGGAVDAFLNSRNESPMPYLHFSILDQGRLFADTAEDAVWLLSADSLHPNLFTWSNPFLESVDSNGPQYEQSARLPGFLAFGASLDVLRPQFEVHCPTMNVEVSDTPWLPNQPSTQTQVNCFGLEYAGFPRKIEAVFGDGQLKLMWILTAKPEEGRVRKALIEEFNQPEMTNDKWEVFDDGQIALRKDKPEILAISQDLVPHYIEDFTND